MGSPGSTRTATKIRYHSYFGPQHDVSFDGGTARRLGLHQRPALDSGEAASFYAPLTADPAGGRHGVRRASARLADDRQRRRPCVPRQVLQRAHRRLRPPAEAMRRLAAARRRPPATSPAATRTTTWSPSSGPRATSHTLWAGTRKGGIYVSTNANAADPPSVTYTRLRRRALGLPQRFPSEHRHRPGEPEPCLHLVLGLFGVLPRRPRLRGDGATPRPGNGTAKDLSADLGDQPITDLVSLAVRLARSTHRPTSAW